MSAPRTDTAASASTVVAVAEAAFRTGAGSVLELADQLRHSGAVSQIDGRVMMDLRVVTGAPVDLEVPAVTIVESGVLA
jgi:hypothetical protein